MLPLDKAAALRRTAGLHWYHVRLQLAGATDNVYFVRKVETRTIHDAIAKVEQMAVFEKPDDTYVCVAANRESMSADDPSAIGGRPV